MKPSKPGVVYIKAKMDPDIADDMESLPGVVRLVRDSETKLVLPLSMSQGSDLEAARSTQRTELNEELRQLKKDDYVTVVAGEYAGHYGLLKTMRSGRFEVGLRYQFYLCLLACISKITFLLTSCRLPKLCLRAAFRRYYYAVKAWTQRTLSSAS